ncbi:MAG: glycogen synthase GlgA [Bryobacteraceae bacterium]
MPRILMASSEAAPYAKTGGLADVLEALPKALAARGQDVAVVIPRYGHIPLGGARRLRDHLPARTGGRSYDFSVWELEPRLYALDCPPLFDRGGIYGAGGGDFPDNHIRFAAFSQAVLGVARHVFRPDVLHGHDWQAALAITYLRHNFARDPTLPALKTLFTIHNLGYQGIFARAQFDDLGLDAPLFHPEALEFYGDVALIKGGLRFADRLNTVSPTYANEIQEPAFGFRLDGLLRARAAVLTGILNGVDYAQWSPESDPFIAARYDARDLGGKLACKLDLLASMGLPLENAARPVVGIVSRLAEMKGFGLLIALTPALLEAGFSMVVLGKGEPVYEKYFRSLASARPDRFAVRIAFDNALAHKIEAGADIFLMPSLYEPCGLNQMYSLRYGTVPVVRATGGLEDTVDETTGFKFREPSSGALWEALQTALAAYAAPDAWTGLMRNGMARDYSWDFSAARYAALYAEMLGAVSWTS